MNTHAAKSQENKNQPAANEVSQRQSGGDFTFQLVDNCPEAIAQGKLQEMANNSPQMKQLRAIQEAADNSKQAKQAAQLQANADNYANKQQPPIQKKEISASGNKHQNGTVNKGTLLSKSTSCPVQRVMYGAPPFAIHTPAPLTPAALARLQSVVNTLVTTITNDVSIHVQQLVVSVEAEGGADFVGGHSTIAGENPAETITILPQPPNPFPSIQITVQRPFAEAATEGEMLGLLAHEIGAHNIPSDFKGINDTAVNAFAPILTPRKIAKGNTPSGGYEFQNWPAPAPGHPPAAWDVNRQHDHVMVADILRNPPPLGGAAPLTRANVYFQTVLNIGDTVWASLIPLARKQTQASELVHLYLVDIARIIASDDGRMPPASHALAIDDVYGELFNQVVLPQRGAHPWIPAARPKGNAFTLGISLAAFIGKVKLEKRLRG